MAVQQRNVQIRGGARPLLRILPRFPVREVASRLLGLWAPMRQLAGGLFVWFCAARVCVQGANAQRGRILRASLLTTLRHQGADTYAYESFHF